MALVYRAEIAPTKVELISGWLPSQSWYAGDPRPELTVVGAYRFDDPDGEVGIETHLLRTGDGLLLQVPLTYRGAPLTGADGALVGTMAHSVLGRRWVYDGCADPVYVSVLAAVVRGDAVQAEELVEVDGRRQRRTPTASVTSSGSGGGEVTVLRVLDTSMHGVDGQALTGTWAGQDEPVLLATVR